MEDFTEWYQPRRSSAGDLAQVRISRNFLSISRYCVKKFFKDKNYARIGFDTTNDRLIIKPTDENDRFGLKLHNKENANFAYLNAKQFITENRLEPQQGKKSIKYQCKWDNENEWIVVENLKK